ncbi:MAG: NADPH-flavin oxidoreductase [Desulfuromonas sp.]|nr:MAG: NADPH-flavin oxidoreductase [Desulfuromonas sp.]
MEKRRLGPCVTFFPQPTTLITSVASDGAPDVMTASWVSIVSKTPPTVAVALNQGRLTYAQIRDSGCFVVNQAPASLALAADYCGLRSGRDADKFKIAGLTPVAASEVAAPLIEECPLNLECRYLKEVELGDYRLVLGEIVEVHAVEAAFAARTQGETAPFEPLVYLGGIREYWSLGECKAEAYKDGLQLEKD